MEDKRSLVLYRTDPLARLLLDKLRLAPVSFALIVAAMTLCQNVLVDAVSNAFVGFPGSWTWEDWFVRVFYLFFIPVLAGYYLWIANALERLLDSLQRSGVVSISNTDLRQITNRYRKPWRELISVLIAVPLGVAFFASRPYFYAWAGTVSVARLAISFFYIVGAYGASMLCLTIIANIRSLRTIFRGKEIQLYALHPDGCGGLKALSSYVLRTAYLLAAFGLFLGETEYRFISHGLARDFWFVHLGVPIYLAIAPMCFFLPLSIAHACMLEARDKLTLGIAKQFQTEYILVQTRLNDGSESFSHNVNKIQQLKTLHDLTIKLPVWPFNAQAGRSLVVSILAPFIPALIDVLFKYVGSFLP